MTKLLAFLNPAIGALADTGGATPTLQFWSNIAGFSIK